MSGTNILLGTAGWSYDDWETIAYPRAKSSDRLRTVARYLDCVEVDSSFYRPPTPQMTANWLKTVSDQPGFRFLAKAWQRFTHERATRWSQSEFDLFARGFEPLTAAERLDALLFQFPWSFRNDAANRDWLSALTEAFAGWPIAVEVRHDSWLRPETFDCLRDRRITFCNIDQPALAHCIRPTDRVTSDTGYYRLHGRNAKNWFREKQEVYGGRYDYLYTGAELEELLPKIRTVAEKTRKTFVIFNNHKDAKAFANALQLKILLAPDAQVRAPATLLARYPDVRATAVADGDEQLSLM